MAKAGVRRFRLAAAGDPGDSPGSALGKSGGARYPLSARGGVVPECCGELGGGGSGATGGATGHPEASWTVGGGGRLSLCLFKVTGGAAGRTSCSRAGRRASHDDAALAQRRRSCPAAGSSTWSDIVVDSSQFAAGMERAFGQTWTFQPRVVLGSGIRAGPEAKLRPRRVVCGVSEWGVERAGLDYGPLSPRWPARAGRFRRARHLRNPL